MTKPALRYLILALVAGSVIVADQLTKMAIMQHMRLHESISVVPNLFSLTYIRNPGAAFGLAGRQQQCLSDGILRDHVAVCAGAAGHDSVSDAGKGLDGAIEYCGDSWRGDR